MNYLLAVHVLELAVVARQPGLPAVLLASASFDKTVDVDPFVVDLDFYRAGARLQKRFNRRRRTRILHPEAQKRFSR